MPEVTVVIPTFNESGNVRELIARLGSACSGLDLEVLFVDDSTDDTPEVILDAAQRSPFPVRMIHRESHERTGGLSGAVVAGFRQCRTEWVAVMDGDLQHPPEMVPVLLDTARHTGADVVVASRYCAMGRADGLDEGTRRLVSRSATALTKSAFPRRLHGCTDPMSGFFVLRLSAIDVLVLQPLGFKILLEILARCDLRVAEEPFVFAERFAGESKASVRQGLRFARQLAGLRFCSQSRQRAHARAHEQVNA